MSEHEHTLSDEQTEALAQAREQADRERAADRTVISLPQRGTTGGAGAISIRPDQHEWTPEQLGALRQLGLAHTPLGDLLAYLHYCQVSGLDPFKREVYLIARKERVNGEQRDKWTVQTGIDGFRTLAARTGDHVATLGPYWAGADGQWRDVWLEDEPPKAARVGIVRANRHEPYWGTALYREFVPMRKVYEGRGDASRPKRNPDGTNVEEPQGLWAKMPAHMIAKCAEALAIRRAFPREAGGIYSEDEMAQADVRESEEAAQAARDAREQARRELVVRPWGAPTEPLSPADTADGEVIDGEVVPVDRAALMAELAAQAETLGTTVPAMTRRWVARMKKNVTDATDVELAGLVETRRAETQQVLLGATVAEVAAATVIPDAEAPAGAEPPPTPPRGRGRGKAGQPEPDVPVTPHDGAQDDGEPVWGPHPYQPMSENPDGPCLLCPAPKGDPVHV